MPLDGNLLMDARTFLDIGGAPDQAETFWITYQGNASQLKAMIWPVDCFVIGIETNTASIAILSRDGTTGFANELQQLGVIAWISVNNAILGHNARVNAGERVYMWTNSTQAVGILCRRITV